LRSTKVGLSLGTAEMSSTSVPTPKTPGRADIEAAAAAKSFEMGTEVGMPFEVNE
jgi:hypothetical protein